MTDMAIVDKIVSIPTEVIVNNVITTIDNNTIVIEVEKIATIAGGSMGPPGPPGINEEDMVYAKQTDFVTDNLIYKGEAVVGSLLSAPLWRIRRLVIGVDGDVSETWASGTANFDKVWDNRLSLVYT